MNSKFVVNEQFEKHYNPAVVNIAGNKAYGSGARHAADSTGVSLNLSGVTSHDSPADLPRAFRNCPTHSSRAVQTQRIQEVDPDIYRCKFMLLGVLCEPQEWPRRPEKTGPGQRWQPCAMCRDGCLVSRTKCSPDQHMTKTHLSLLRGKLGGT